MILEKINKPNDIKQLSPIEYNQLADEIRRFLIEKISKTGGHLASNLGVVELTMALHLAFNLPQDKLIWDVGHQSYTHKILTGRKNQFDQLRKFGGMSGFPKRNESHFDAFDTGHSSTSISAGLGLVKARDLKNEHYSVVSVIGDGALTGGNSGKQFGGKGRVAGPGRFSPRRAAYFRRSRHAVRGVPPSCQTRRNLSRSKGFVKVKSARK